jgi:hypothetical protein
VRNEPNKSFPINKTPENRTPNPPIRRQLTRGGFGLGQLGRRGGGR